VQTVDSLTNMQQARRLTLNLNHHSPLQKLNLEVELFDGCSDNHLAPIKLLLHKHNTLLSKESHV